jgi:hypothetical protein
MKTTLTSLLKENAASQDDLLRRQQDRQEKFEKEVRDALSRLETRRAHEQKSPRGGFQFEDALVNFVTAAVQGAPCVVEATGNSAGALSRCKKGDVVVRFTSESAFENAGVVFEAKRDAAYNAQKALEELDTARKNRGAAAGVFVMAASHAAPTFPRFARHGSHVLVTWDESNPTTDPYLHAAILLGLALVSRSKTVGDPGDREALRDIEARIEGELTRLQKMEKHNDSIRKSSDSIGEEIRKAQSQLEVLVRKAKDTLRALKIELVEENEERRTPIELPPESFEQAVVTVGGKRPTAAND